VLKGLLRVFGIILITCTLLTGCGNKVKTDILDYSDDFSVLLDDIAEVSDEIDAEQGKEDFKTSLNESVIPKLEDVKTKAEKIEPQTEEVKQLKDLFIDCVTLNLEGCNTVLKAIDTSNADTFQKAKDQFEQGDTLENEFRSKWDEMAKEQGIDSE
jgi:uncharacterized protein YceK